MDQQCVDSIVNRWRDLRAYAQRLVADLDEQAMVRQPLQGVTLNHAAWVLAHLSVYGPLLARILRDEPIEDPADHPFGRNSRPLPDPAAYPSRDELLRRFCEGYDEAVEALACAGQAVFSRPAPLERWRGRFPTVAAMPAHFLVQHNAVHLGQLSAWRRACGLPPV